MDELIDNMISLIEDAKSDLLDFINSYVEGYGMYFNEELFNFANHTLDRYYADYQPTVYVRTGNLRSAISYVWQPNNYKFGIDISPALMDNYYDDDGYISDVTPEDVVNTSWEKGMHGVKITPKTMSPSPQKILEKHSKSKRFKHRCDREGVKYAQNQKYRVLSF